MPVVDLIRSRLPWSQPAPERRAALLAAAANFMLLGSYYLLRPLRDAMATVVGAADLPRLYTGTFILMLLCAPVYAALVSRFRLSRVLFGVFWFWLANILLFYLLFREGAPGPGLATAYYWWFSVANLYMIAVYWSLMADMFSAAQASRSFPAIAAAGSAGTIAGSLITLRVVELAGTARLLLLAAAGFAVLILVLQLLMREKPRLQSADQGSQQTQLDRALAGSAFSGFSMLGRSSLLRWQALFMLLMTWVATLAYYYQTSIVQSRYGDVAQRTRALADIDLWVNVASALTALLGTGPIVRWLGVTAGLLINPLLMAAALVLMPKSPGLFAVQALQIVRRAGQYAIARPCREICFTVVAQEGRYKAKALVDTAVYRLGDLSGIWILALLRAVGLASRAVLAVGVAIALLWGFSALMLGRRYEQARGRVTGPEP